MLTKQLIAECLLPILQLNPHTYGSRNRARRRAKKIVSPRGLGHLQLHSILQTWQGSYPHETSTKCLVKYDLQNENTSLYVNVHGGGIPQGLSTTGRVTVNQWLLKKRECIFSRADSPNIHFQALKTPTLNKISRINFVTYIYGHTHIYIYI